VHHPQTEIFSRFQEAVNKNFTKQVIYKNFSPTGNGASPALDLSNLINLKTSSQNAVYRKTLTWLQQTVEQTYQQKLIKIHYEEPLLVYEVPSATSPWRLERYWG